MQRTRGSATRRRGTAPQRGAAPRRPSAASARMTTSSSERMYQCRSAVCCLRAAAKGRQPTVCESARPRSYGALQVQYGVQHQLPRPVVRRLAAALRAVQLERRRGGVEAQVGQRAPRAERVHRRVLQHQQLVRRRRPRVQRRQATPQQRLLPVPGAHIRNLPDPGGRACGDSLSDRAALRRAAKTRACWSCMSYSVHARRVPRGAAAAAGAAAQHKGAPCRLRDRQRATCGVRATSPACAEQRRVRHLTI